MNIMCTTNSKSRRDIKDRQYATQTQSDDPLDESTCEVKRVRMDVEAENDTKAHAMAGAKVHMDERTTDQVSNNSAKETFGFDTFNEEHTTAMASAKSDENISDENVKLLEQEAMSHFKNSSWKGKN